MRRVALVALVALGGCSFVTSGAPRRYDGRAAPDCTTTSIPPVLDASAVILLGLLGAPLLFIGEGCAPGMTCADDDPLMRNLGAAAVTAGFVYAVSAYTGFSNVSSCKAAIAKHEAMNPGVR